MSSWLNVSVRRCMPTNLAELRSAAAALRADLPDGSDIRYSLKANPHPIVVRTLVAQGLGRK